MMKYGHQFCQSKHENKKLMLAYDFTNSINK